MPDFGALGVTFAPLSDNNNPTAAGQPQASPIQQAIKILSLRIPRVIGASGLASGPLLNSPGGGILGNSMLRVLQMLFGDAANVPTGNPFRLPSATSSAGRTSMSDQSPVASPSPTPRVTPGVVRTPEGTAGARWIFDEPQPAPRPGPNYPPRPGGSLVRTD